MSKHEGQVWALVTKQELQRFKKKKNTDQKSMKPSQKIHIYMYVCVRQIITLTIILTYTQNILHVFQSIVFFFTCKLLHNLFRWQTAFQTLFFFFTEFIVGWQQAKMVLIPHFSTSFYLFFVFTVLPLLSAIPMYMSNAVKGDFFSFLF